ncbi:MAG: gliding motility lipoprotein GldD [Pyrinomonadaceae bacterium]|nr:gliding motility lipoprotein GldD [Sphingobacteriaceae bacterium]
MRFASYICLFIILLYGCSSGSDYSPKPRGFFKIDFPEKKYQTYKDGCNYTFQYPVYATLLPDKSKDAKPCWIDVSFPQFNGKIHLSYQAIASKKTFNSLVEDARSFAFKHTVKASAINEGQISYPQHKVYGTYYSIKGNTASAIQFFLTDSTKNYLRGALYFYEEPRQDSIKPVLEFLEKDINVMIKSFRWK